MTVRCLLVGWLSSVTGAIAAPALPPATVVDHAAEFDAVEARTAGLPLERRVVEFRATFDKVAPGLYADADAARLDRRIAKSLAEFPRHPHDLP